MFCTRKVGFPRLQVDPFVGVAKVNLTTKASAEGDGQLLLHFQFKKIEEMKETILILFLLLKLFEAIEK